MPVPHRPPRAPVPLPDERTLVVAAPPAPPAPGQGWLLGVLPAVGILPVVLLGAGGSARGTGLLVGLLAVPLVLGTVGVVGAQRRRLQRDHKAAVARWWAHLHALEHEAAEAAARQRLALDRRHPADLLAVLAGHAFERRLGDDDALHLTVGCGEVPARVRLGLAPIGPLDPVDAGLAAAARAAVERAATLAAAPLAVDLAAVRVLAVVGSRRAGCVRRLAAEVAVLHAPGEVGLAGALDRDGAEVVRVVADHRPGPHDTALDLAIVGCATAAAAPAGAGAVLDTDARTLRVGAHVCRLDALEELEPAAAQAISVALSRLTPTAGTVPPLAELLGVDAPPLAVPLGVDPLGQPVLLDLAEAASGGDGPHGLLVGATGTGKSVLLRTVVTGLAARRTPAEVSLLLVDFKGGAAFADLAALPHVAGLVTNLAEDPALLARVTASLTGELDRRQRVLRAAGAASLREAPQLLPALVVVVDEAGELLAAAPDVADVLARIGRVGRSLGVHLLLATQTWDGGRMRGLDAHLRYRVCLRTVGPDDSRAVLGSDAANRLPARPGAAWFAVDGALRRVDVAPPPTDPVALARTDGGRARPVWLPPLPAVLPWSDGTLGLVDRPELQTRAPLVLPPEAHVAVVGGPRSGVSTALRAVVAAAGAPRVDVVDLTGGLTGLEALPEVGTVAGRDDPELVAAVVSAVAADLDRRRPGDPPRLLVVDGVAGLRSADGSLEGALADVAARGLGRGVRLVLGARRWSELRGGLHEACGFRLELRLGDPAESQAGRAAATPADAPPGRGVTADGHPLQVAEPPPAAGRPGAGQPPIRVLPSHVAEPGRAGDGAFLLGVGGPDLLPVGLDLLAPGRHLVVAGDAGSGRSTVLRRLARHLAAGAPVHLVDPRRTHLDLARSLASWDHDVTAASRRLAEVADGLRRRLPDADAGPDEIAGAAGASAPPCVVVIDDLDLLETAAGLGDLAALLPYAPEVGLHVVVARAAAGRAFDPLSQRLRAAAPWVVQLPGEHAEGPAAGRGAPDRVGRALLSRGPGPAVRVQCYAA